MKTAYFDCFAGISGDMTLGALVDAGVDIDELRTELAKLNLSGFSVEPKKCVKNGITGTKVTVITEEQKAHRHLSHIVEIIEKSGLSDNVKKRSIDVFHTLAKAEAKIHNTTPEKIHFHEVGALDAIVDVVGAVVGLELLGVEQLFASPVSVGTGFVECQHGKIPVPAPATMEILQGAPLVATGIEAELTTPTGAAIVKTLATAFRPFPPMTLESIGYGAGSRDHEIPNLLRIVVGDAANGGFETDQVDLIAANIDDMNPEHYEHLLERLFDEGALDVTLTPLIMKKGRPGIELNVMARPADTERMTETVFRESTTLGVRVQRITRKILPRESLTVATSYGELRVKISKLEGRVRDVAPEYEDCKRLAKANKAPLREVYNEARRCALEALGEEETERNHHD
jgi:uncharacterized protein (TIGR00299 family) protein